MVKGSGKTFPGPFFIVRYYACLGTRLTTAVISDTHHSNTDQQVLAKALANEITSLL